MWTFCLNAAQISWIAAVSIVVVATIVLTIVFISKNIHISKKFKYTYYKKIYKIVLNNDYYLLNNFEFRVDDNTKARIDHVIYADKYIYLINDYYYPGSLSGKEKDTSLVYTDKKGTPHYTQNPLITSRKIISYLSILTGIEPSIFVGISLTNSDSKHMIESTSKQCFVVQVKQIKKLIKAIESRPIGKISEKDMKRVVNATKDLANKAHKCPQSKN